MENCSTKTSTQRKRKRTMVALACDNCRASHFKCDGEPGCYNCTRRDLPCTYSEAKRRGRKPLVKKSENEMSDLGKIKKELIILTRERDLWKSKYTNEIEEFKIKIGIDKITGSSLQMNLVKSNPIDVNPLCTLANNESFKVLYPNLIAKDKTIKIRDKEEVYYDLWNYIKAFSDYSHFLYPDIKLPKDGVHAFNILMNATDGTEIPNDHDHNIIINAVLSIGALFCRNNAQSDEFSEVAKTYAKTVAFQKATEHSALAFSILSYLCLCRSEIDEAKMFNSYAVSLCKASDNVNNKVKTMIYLTRVMLFKKNRKKTLQRLIYESKDLGQLHHLVNIFKNIYCDYDEESLCDSQWNFENVPQEIIPFMFIGMHVAKGFQYMRNGRKDQAYLHSISCIEVLNAQKVNFQNCPFFFIKIMSKLSTLCIDCSLLDCVNVIIDCLSGLPWEKPKLKAIESITIKVKTLRTLYYSFKKKKATENALNQPNPQPWMRLINN